VTIADSVNATAVLQREDGTFGFEEQHWSANSVTANNTGKMTAAEPVRS
jgi:hypothetical protein